MLWGLHCKDIDQRDITGRQNRKPATLTSAFRVKATPEMSTTTRVSYSVLNLGRFLVHLCNSRSIQSCGVEVSGLKYSMAHQIVPIRTTKPTGVERMSIRAVTTLLSMPWNTNSRTTRRHASAHTPAVYLSETRHQYAWSL